MLFPLIVHDGCVEMMAIQEVWGSVQDWSKQI